MMGWVVIDVHNGSTKIDSKVAHIRKETHQCIRFYALKDNILYEHLIILAVVRVFIEWMSFLLNGWVIYSRKKEISSH